MTSAVVDTRSLQTGDGFIELTEPAFAIDVQGAEFQSAGGFATATARVDVTWA